jgi:hypothetical protein
VLACVSVMAAGCVRSELRLRDFDLGGGGREVEFEGDSGST